MTPATRIAVVALVALVALGCSDTPTSPKPCTFRQAVCGGTTARLLTRPISGPTQDPAQQVAASTARWVTYYRANPWARHRWVLLPDGKHYILANSYSPQNFCAEETLLYTGAGSVLWIATDAFDSAPQFDAMLGFGVFAAATGLMAASISLESCLLEARRWTDVVKIDPTSAWDRGWHGSHWYSDKIIP